MKKTMLKRAAKTWERNGRTVLALGVGSMAGAANTETDTVSEGMEADIAVSTVEAMMMMDVSTLGDRRCLHGQYCHTNIVTLTRVAMLFLCLKMRPTL
jgi:hypothetical protein